MSPFISATRAACASFSARRRRRIYSSGICTGADRIILATGKDKCAPEVRIGIEQGRPIIAFEAAIHLLVRSREIERTFATIRLAMASFARRTAGATNKVVVILNLPPQCGRHTATTKESVGSLTAHDHGGADLAQDDPEAGARHGSERLGQGFIPFPYQYDLVM